MKGKPANNNFFRDIVKQGNKIRKKFEETLNSIDESLAEESWEKIEKSDAVAPNEMWQMVQKPESRVSYADALKKNLTKTEKNENGYVGLAEASSNNKEFGR